MLGSEDMIAWVEGSVRVASESRLFKLWVLALALTGAASGGFPSAAASQAPNEEWRTLRTEHFRVTFPEHLEALGRRAAARAEAAYAGLAVALPRPRSGTIDLLVTDHSDESNGYALVKPSRRMTVFAAPPTDGFQLAYYDDWLELVITHELAHVVHLDHTGNPIGEVGRAVFGRAPVDWPLFPELATPDWVIEGLATWYESRLTDAGRVRGTFHEMQIRTAVLEGRFEGIGQASGRSPVWPGGNRSYLYGSLFFDYMLARHGEERMSAFVDAVGGQWIPYRIDAAARSAFGESFTDGWRAWASDLRTRYAGLDAELAELGPLTEPERLTDGARWGLHPVVSPDGSWLAHTWADGTSDPQLRVASPDGSGSRELTRTNGLATFDWRPDGSLLVSQLEQADPYDVYADLYLVDGVGTRRLTHGARLGQPSVAPDGRWAVAVQQGGGTNGLVRVDLSTGAVTTLVPPSADVHWSFPEVSPDGRWIAVSRWTPGGYQDIALLEASGAGEARTLTQDRAVDVAPTWSPDGRWLVWTSDRTGIQNLLAAEIDSGTGRAGPARLLTNVRTGVLYPSVDPTGRWVYFSGYHVDGWEIERVPFRPDTAPLAPPPAARFTPPEPQRILPGQADGDVGGYSPLPTLRPSYWEVVYRDPEVAPATSVAGASYRRRELLGFGLGAKTSAVDLVGRHEYAAEATVFTSGGRAEGALSYVYRGLGNPVLSAAAAQRWDFAGRGAVPDTFYVLDRERSMSAAVTFLSDRWRRDVALSLGGALAWSHREQLDNELRTVPLDPAVPEAARFGDLTASLSLSTARSHSFQTGGTRGMSLSVQGRRRLHLNVPGAQRDSVGVDLSFDDVYGRVRGYLPLWRVGFARHVLAVQAAGGMAFGPGAELGRFGVGGASGTAEDVTGFTLFGGGFVPLPIRGYEEYRRFGRWAWTTSAEYRFPLALVHRGAGAWPLHLDRLMGSLFVDAGNAWEPSTRGDPLVSAGGELSAQVLALYDGTLLLRVGVAVPLVEGDGATAYVRVGIPF